MTSLSCITSIGQYCSVLNRGIGSALVAALQWQIQRGSVGSRLLNILWKWNNLVSVRPNYFIFMGFGLSETKLFHFHGIFKINETKSVKRTPTPYTYGPHFQESIIRPSIWRYTWKIRSFEWFNHPLFCLMVLRSFVKINLLLRIMDPLKRKSPNKICLILPVVIPCCICTWQYTSQQSPQNMWPHDTPFNWSTVTRVRHTLHVCVLPNILS